jgi:hypothetical protein
MAQLTEIANAAPRLKDAARSSDAEPPAVRTRIDDKPVIAVRSEHLKELIGSIASEKAVAAALDAQGILIRHRRSRTRQLTIPGKGRRRYYCLRLPTHENKASVKAKV